MTKDASIYDVGGGQKSKNLVDLIISIIVRI